MRLWDVAARRQLHSLSGHRGNVNAVAFALDGKTLASAGYDGDIRIWRVADGAPVKTLKGNGFGVNSLAFTAGSAGIVTAGIDETLRIRHIATGEEVTTLDGHEGSIFAIALTSDRRFMASGGTDKLIRLWDLESGRLVRYMRGHDRPIWSLAFSADGKTLLTGGSDEVVRAWQVDNGGEIGEPFRMEDDAEEPEDPGARLFATCRACHSLTADGETRAGPTLYGLFGRPIGQVPGYRYSDALKNSTIVWNEQTINDLFHEGPDLYVPGTKMPLQRMPKAGDRADLIAFLKRATAP